MMENTADSTAQAPVAARSGPSMPSASSHLRGRSWETPRVEVISLSCEISAYAPDEDGWPPF